MTHQDSRTKKIGVQRRLAIASLLQVGLPMEMMKSASGSGAKERI